MFFHLSIFFCCPSDDRIRQILHPHIILKFNCIKYRIHSCFNPPFDVGNGKMLPAKCASTCHNPASQRPRKQDIPISCEKIFCLFHQYRLFNIAVFGASVTCITSNLSKFPFIAGCRYFGVVFVHRKASIIK